MLVMPVMYLHSSKDAKSHVLLHNCSVYLSHSTCLHLSYILKYVIMFFLSHIWEVLGSAINQRRVTYDFHANTIFNYGLHNLHSLVTCCSQMGGLAFSDVGTGCSFQTVGQPTSIHPSLLHLYCLVWGQALLTYGLHTKVHREIFWRLEGWWYN